MFEIPRRGRQARKSTTNVPKILDLKSSSEEIFSENRRWVPLMFRVCFFKSDSIIKNYEGGNDPGGWINNLCKRFNRTLIICRLLAKK